MITTCEDCGAVFGVTRDQYRSLIRAMCKGDVRFRWRCADCLIEYERTKHTGLIEQGEAIGEGEL